MILKTSASAKRTSADCARTTSSGILCTCGESGGYGGESVYYRDSLDYDMIGNRLGLEFKGFKIFALICLSCYFHRRLQAVRLNNWPQRNTVFAATCN